MAFKGAREHAENWVEKLILKYDLGKSLSKQIRLNMPDNKTFLDYIFKHMKNACNMR